MVMVCVFWCEQITIERAGNHPETSASRTPFIATKAFVAVIVIVVVIGFSAGNYPCSRPVTTTITPQVPLPEISPRSDTATRV